MKTISQAFAAVFILAAAASACYMVNRPSATIRTADLRGRIVLDGKPLEDAKLALYRCRRVTGPIKNTDCSDKAAAGSTDYTGEFHFGSVRPGKYRVVMTKPSSEEFDVTVLAPDKSSLPLMLSMDVSGDWCFNVRVVHEDGSPSTDKH